MRRFLMTLVVLCLLLALAPAPSAVAQGKEPPPVLNTLIPGGDLEISQTLAVNIVFVGYEPAANGLDEATFRAQLPQIYRPVLRYPSFYGDTQYLGLTFHYNYNLIYADNAFEDAFFGYLASIAQPAPLTTYQEAYNTQQSRSLDIASNATIDAPSVEQWLADNANSLLGIDTRQYTVFLVNWYGRADFQHHVYTKTDEPDPDTGVNFGTFQSRTIIAWGGTTPDDEESGLGSLHRIWFYDLSAGPEVWTDNWNLDNADMDGDGVPDYRMPPVWEYGNTNGYRPFDTLSIDLGLVLRYVAINLLFTPSPIYKPAISPPDLPSDLQLDINVFQLDPGGDGTAYFVPHLIAGEINELQPHNTVTLELNSSPVSSRLQEIYLCFFNGVSCFGNRIFGIAFADLFLYFNDHLLQYLEGDSDYEIPIFAFDVPNELFTCCLGYADNNWSDGTQSYIFAFVAPFLRTAGYGFSTTIVHEVGHHVGLSHPHDGYDFETGVDYSPFGPFYFAWLGDEANSVMSYLSLNLDFSQFDRDSMNRYLTSVYLNQANAVLGKIYATPKAGQVAALLGHADSQAAAALAAYEAMAYEAAAGYARAAYGDVLAAAAAINVKVEPQNWTADYKAMGMSYKFIDPVDYHHRLDP